MIVSQFIIEQRISTGRVFLDQFLLSMLGWDLGHHDGGGGTYPGGGGGGGSAFGRRLLVFLLARNPGVVVGRQW